MPDVRPPALDPSQLLAEADWLRSLARRLAGDRDDADDLLQETYAAALRRPPDPSRPLRPWLAAVLRNLWHMRHRATRRRVARDLAAEGERDSPPTADALLERAELLRDLAALVVELSEPVRTVLLLRHCEGLSSVDIARVLGIPEGTVRWRLKQAVDHLRTELDAGAGGRGWRRAFAAPLAFPLASSEVGLLGGWLVKKWLAIAVVALVSVGGAAYLLRRHPPVVATTTPRPPTGGAQLVPRPPAPAPTRATATATGEAIAVAEPGAPGGVFAGRVINWSTGEGVVGAELTFATDGETTTVPSGAGGGFRFAPPRPGRHVLVSASAVGFLPYAPEWGQSPVILRGRADRRIEGTTIYLFPAVDYVARVVDAEDEPIAGASVRLLGTPQGEQVLESLVDRFVTDQRGEVVFHAPDGAVLEARAPGHGVGRAELDGVAALTHRLTIQLARTGEGAELGSATLSGIVVDPAGQGLAGAAVSITPLRSARPDKVWLPRLFTQSDDSGRFDLTGLDPGDYDLAVDLDGYAPASLRARAGDRGVRVVVGAGAALRGVVTDRVGAPVPSFTLVVSVPDGLARRALTTRSVLDAEGRFELAHLEPGDYRLVASAHGFAPSGEVAVHLGETGADASIVLPRGGTLRGKVFDRAGPLASARVMLEGVAGGATISPLAAGTLTDQRGEFVMTGLPIGTVGVQIAAFGHNIRILGGLVVTDGASLGPLAVELHEPAPGQAPQVELVGIGVKVEPSDETILVNGVVPGGGAEQAGIVAGDRIVAIDGATVDELGFATSIQRIRGIEGSRVSLRIRRGQVELEISAERRPLSTP